MDVRVNQLITQSEARFKEGELHLKAGEREQAREKFDKAVDNILESGMDNVLIVAHGHFSRILTARWLELPPTEGRHFILGTAKVCTLGWDK